MAKSSRYMQGLLGVITSGRRRKPVYIRQHALVSKLYPIFDRDILQIVNTVSDVRLEFVRPPIVVEPVDLLEIVNTVPDVYWENIVKRVRSKDSLEVSTSLAAISLDAVVKRHQISVESLQLSTAVVTVSMDQVGIYHTIDPELLSGSTSLVDIQMVKA